jgi:hypothetical protein
MAKLLRLFLAFLALLPTAANAGPKPSDVPTYVAVTPSYASGVTPNTRNVSTPPAYAFELADIPTSTTGRVRLGTYSGFDFCAMNGVDCIEAKFRTHINCTHILRDDPIRNFGQPGQSHLHQFCGNSTINAFSTFASLRASPWSAAAGDTLNNSGYWFPCPTKTNPFSDGKNYCVRADYSSVYYTEDPSESPYLKKLIRGLRYVFGTNMDDPDDLAVKAEIAAANAQPGTSGRYSYITDGFVGWHCLPTPNGNPLPISAQSLKNADGSDPFGGQCTAGMQVYAEVNSATCWDGRNLWSTTGYGHMRQPIRDNFTGANVCPQNYYRVPQLVMKFFFTHQGFSDYGNWRLSSDDMAATAAGHSIPNGGSFHTDWFGAWNGDTFTKFQFNCIGVENHSPHQCSDSIFSDREKLIVLEAGPVRSPQIDLNTQYGTTLASRMFLISGSSNGPKTLCIHDHTGDGC